MVLINEFKDFKYERKGILLCLRHDVEGVLSEENKKYVENIVFTLHYLYMLVKVYIDFSIMWLKYWVSLKKVN